MFLNLPDSCVKALVGLLTGKTPLLIERLQRGLDRQTIRRTVRSLLRNFVRHGGVYKQREGEAGLRTITHSHLTAAVVSLLLGAVSVVAQTGPLPPGNHSTQSSAELVGATHEYKASTEELLRLEEQEINKVAA